MLKSEFGGVILVLAVILCVCLMLSFDPYKSHYSLCNSLQTYLGQSDGGNNELNGHRITLSDAEAIRNSGFAMDAVDILMFMRYTYDKDTYLEWGSGGSTRLALHMINKQIVSIEHAKVWCDIVDKDTAFKFGVLLNKIHYLCVDTHTNLIQWGRAKDSSQKIKRQMSKYYIQNIIDEKVKGEIMKQAVFTKSYFDVVLIDGRFRVACALKLILDDLISCSDSIVMIHDFLNRRKYHSPIYKWFKIEEKGLVLIALKCKLTYKNMSQKMKLELEKDFNFYLSDQER